MLACHDSLYKVECVTDVATTCQVGLMLHENTINNILEGGPADQCGQLERGDVIIAVDGEQVTAESVAEALIGSDIPSTWVVLTVLGSGKVRRDCDQCPNRPFDRSHFRRERKRLPERERDR